LLARSVRRTYRGPLEESDEGIEYPVKEENSVRAEQTVSEMVVESLARQAEALSEETDRPFGEAFAEILKTHAGSKLAELADGPHRHEKAADWQAGLLIDRKVQRTAYLCASKGGHDAGEACYSWHGRYTERVESIRK
jgi:hypothetical protein